MDDVIVGETDASAVERELPPAPDAFAGALLDSRQRWRDLVALFADFVFETDAAGRFVFVAPADALGWPATTLLGQPAELLLTEPEGARVFNPFRPAGPVHRSRTWLRHASGRNVCLQFGAMPLIDAEGRVTGARGIAQDVTDQDRSEASVAAALHRGEVIDHILTRMREEVLAPRMMQAALQALAHAMGAEGCAIVDMLGDPNRAANKAHVLHEVGNGLADVLNSAVAMLESAAGVPQSMVAADGRPIILALNQTRFGEEAGLVVWRPPGRTAWDADDVALVTSASSVIRVILEHASIQREMARQARTDPLTGLLNRRAFLEEVSRRIDRLEREGLPGTLMFVDLDNFKDLNDRCGHEAGDDALRIIATLLRTTVRPIDIVARLGGDEFALWLDGADELAAAERAESLRIDAPSALSHLTFGQHAAVTASIGIATRWPGRGEELDAVMMRADRVMYEVKRAGRGHWRVARED